MVCWNDEAGYFWLPNLFFLYDKSFLQDEMISTSHQIFCSIYRKILSVTLRHSVEQQTLNGGKLLVGMKGFYSPNLTKCY
jgi:hypothetical protein